jgi:hypothetical protein
MGLAKHHVALAARRHVGCIFYRYMSVIFTSVSGTFEHTRLIEDLSLTNWPNKH